MYVHKYGPRRQKGEVDCIAFNGGILVDDKFKDLEGNGLGPIEIFSDNFSGDTGEYHENVNYIIRCLSQYSSIGPPEDNYSVAKSFGKFHEVIKFFQSRSPFERSVK
jgi:hypothetical protein